MPLTIADRFSNRFEAGRQLARVLKEAFSTPALKKHKKSLNTALVVAIPRGGVPVAEPVAKQFGVPLDLVLVKKLTPPESHELAVGAVAADGGLVVDEKMALEFGASPSYIEAARQKIVHDLELRAQLLRGGSPAEPVKDRLVLVVDDGMATGYTMRAAAELLRRQGAREVIVAVPVTSLSALALVEPAAPVVAVKKDPALLAVGSHYLQFDPTSDQEVQRILHEV